MNTRQNGYNISLTGLSVSLRPPIGETKKKLDNAGQS